MPETCGHLYTKIRKLVPVIYLSFKRGQGAICTPCSSDKGCAGMTQCLSLYYIAKLTLPVNLNCVTDKAGIVLPICEKTKALISSLCFCCMDSTTTLGGPRGRVVKVADFSALDHSIISPMWVRDSHGARIHM